MFWTVIRWGGSAAIILLVLAAVLLSSKPAADDGATVIPAEQGEATPIEVAPADSAPQQNKNFNL
jgi:hypothetical protein